MISITLRLLFGLTGVDHVIVHGTTEVLSSRRHRGHHGPAVFPRIITFNRIERTLSVGASDGIKVASKYGHSHTQPPRHHGGHFCPLVFLRVVPLDMVEARNSVLQKSKCHLASILKHKKLHQ